MPTNMISDKVIQLCEEGLAKLTTVHPGRITARSYLRGALALLGEGVKPVDAGHEMQVAGGTVDEGDFDDAVKNCDLLLRKVKQALSEKEPQMAAKYIKSMHQLMGDGGDGSGSLTPRPRDYSAAMSRVDEASLSSPAKQRLPSQMEHARH